MGATLTELGEQKIVEKIIESLDLMPRIPVSFGDDVSAIEVKKDVLAVMKTDMLVGETDMPPGMSLMQASRKAVVMNISDFAAKGATPLAILVALGLPRSITEKEIMEIAQGLNCGAREYNTYVIGGDTNEASDLVICCSVFGFCKREDFVRREGARPGDLVAITGLFGNPPCGLKILLEKLEVPHFMKKPILESVLTPKARLREGLALASTRALTSSIDSSDGLAWSLYELSKASEVGFLINHLPLTSEAKRFADLFNLDPFELCFYGGEEYELIVTVKPDMWKKAEEAVKRTGGSLIKIGIVTKAKDIIYVSDGEERKIEKKGWEHFKS